MRRNKSLIILALVAGWVACTSAPEGKSEEERKKAIEDSLAACEKPVFDEYKASELAALMRKMDGEMSQLKEKILAGHFSADSITMDYAGIKTATPTDPTVKTDVFAGMADAFLFNIGKLKEHGDGDPKEIFNTAIGSCLTCHEQFCPGPMVRIRKLKI